MNLYNLNFAIEEVFERAIDPDTGEILDETALDEWNALQIDRGVKLSDTLDLYKEYVSQGAAIKAEETALAERRKAKERKAASILKLIERSLAPGEKFETPRGVVKWVKSSAVEVAAGAILPEEYVRTNITREPDKTKLKAAIKAGEEIEGVSIVERLNMSIK